jgi:hypothetical protein
MLIVDFSESGAPTRLIFIIKDHLLFLEHGHSLPPQLMFCIIFFPLLLAELLYLFFILRLFDLDDCYRWLLILLDPLNKLS